MKKIMSGRKLAKLLCYIHVCKDAVPIEGDQYDPSYKVAEFMEYL